MVIKIGADPGKLSPDPLVAPVPQIRQAMHCVRHRKCAGYKTDSIPVGSVAQQEVRAPALVDRLNKLRQLQVHVSLAIVEGEQVNICVRAEVPLQLWRGIYPGFELANWHLPGEVALKHLIRRGGGAHLEGKEGEPPNDQVQARAA